MNQITINGKVTMKKEFRTMRGYGINIFVVDKSDAGTIYFQVVVYDEIAKKIYQSVKEDEMIKVTGQLKAKPFDKKDGTRALSLMVENPQTLEQANVDLLHNDYDTQLPQSNNYDVSTVTFEPQQSYQNIEPEFEEFPFG